MRAYYGSGEKTGILQVFMAASGQTKSRENHNMFFESPYTGEQIEIYQMGRGNKQNGGKGIQYSQCGCGNRKSSGSQRCHSCSSRLNASKTEGKRGAPKGSPGNPNRDSKGKYSKKIDCIV
jgi:hypothetical protein